MLSGPVPVCWLPTMLTYEPCIEQPFDDTVRVTVPWLPGTGQSLLHVQFAWTVPLLIVPCSVALPRPPLNPMVAETVLPLCVNV
jgi:hypothetical protein